MILLGIETSCDETSAAVVKNGREVLSNIIASQVDLHAPFGGVVPEIAARRHIECIGYIVDEALEKANLTFADIDGYAVANGPGLAGALLVGLNYAKGLAFVNKKPLIGVHHIEAHVCANYLDSNLEPPFLSLVVSGGHTSILSIADYNSYKVLGSTRDDAAGEAFDKVARVIGLPYPGGPQIDSLAHNGLPTAFAFPRAKVFVANNTNETTKKSSFGSELDFSFSGLKTAVMQTVARLNKSGEEVNIADIAASFQEAVVDVLVDRTITACEREGFTKVALAGGVACNNGLRVAMEKATTNKGIQLFMPSPIYCTDNAAMIAARGYYSLISGYSDGWNLNAFPGRMLI